jgi:hypothetical protein
MSGLRKINKVGTLSGLLNFNEIPPYKDVVLCR